MIIVDVWGGEANEEHIARFIQPMNEALKTAEIELNKGLLVNFRTEIAWGTYNQFDTRN